MTGPTTDGFTISASSEYDSNYAGWNACTGATSSEWAMNGASFPAWWKVQCPSPFVVSQIKLSKRIHQEFIDTFDFQGSNDGSDWTTLVSSIGQLAPIGIAPDSLIININDPTNTPYTYYRIYATAGIGGNPGMAIFQMYA
jgi:hypothetical protein